MARISFREACARFKEQAETGAEEDIHAARERWGVFTDQLCKAGKITLRQYETWGYPPHLRR